jgi:hypothetical protein
MDKLAADKKDMDEAKDNNVPDVSLEIDQALTYTDFLHDEVSKLPTDAYGGVTLTKNQVNAFAWMLCDTGNILRKINEALYPKD